MERKPRILLIEDDPVVYDILLSLMRTWGYDCFLATEGSKALMQIGRVSPSLIILDSHLPDMNSFHLSEAIKKDIFASHIPIIMLVEKRQIRKKMLKLEKGVDDYIIKPPDPIDLEVRIEMTLRRTEHHFHASALTKLPGGRTIEKEIGNRIESGKQFSVLYFDVDNFKSFNDKYGYRRGDGVINQTTHIISTALKKMGDPGDFIGHIGGDDFIAITTPEREEELAQEVISEFDRLIPLHYDEEDRVRGMIRMENRQGKASDFPLMSISISIVNNQHRELTKLAEISQISAEIKHYLKTQPGSGYLVDRRLSQVKRDAEEDAKAALKRSAAADESSAVACVEDVDAVEAGAGAGSTEQAAEVKDVRGQKKDSANNDMPPLGQHLLNESVVSPEDLEEALRYHWSSGLPLGETILLMGLADAKKIGAIIASQLGVSYTDSDGEVPDKDFINMFPKDFLLKFRLMPIRQEDKDAIFAMTDPTNKEVFETVKQEYKLNVKPYFTFENQWEKMYKEYVDVKDEFED